MTDRDLDETPYTEAENRVADYISELTNGTIGAGDDPVGFLIASHATLAQHIQELAAALRGLEEVIASRQPAEPEQQMPE